MENKVLYKFVNNDFILEVKQIDLKIAKEWDRDVQPLIDQINGGTDNGWRWKYWYATSLLLNTMGQKAKGYCIYLWGMPIGMVFGLFNYSCEEKKSSTTIPTYLWLASKNPALNTICEFIEEEKGYMPKLSLVDIFLEILLNETENLKNQRTLWLHASPHGNNPLRLLEYYKNKGLVHCPLVRKMSHRRDDGRYLFYPSSLGKKIDYALIEN